MALLKQSNAILRLYTEVLEKGLNVKEDESASDIIEKCEKRGQFIFFKDGNSNWYFVRSTNNGSKCIRMIFALKDGDGGKVHNIERIISIISDLERVLVYVDSINVIKENKFTYINVVKKLEGSKCQHKK